MYFLLQYGFEPTPPPTPEEEESEEEQDEDEDGFAGGGLQRWDLSKNLHDQIFEPEILHTIFIHNEMLYLSK